MAIPSAALQAAKDLLRIGDTDRDTQIQRRWESALAAVCRETDWFTEREDLSAAASTHTYTPTSRAIRFLAILHNQVQIYKTTARQMDYLRNTWQTDSDGTPELWWQDKIPSFSGVLRVADAETFSVHPAPSSSATGASGFITYFSAIPTDDDPTPTWIDPFLILRVAGEYLRESAEERLDTVDEGLVKFYLALSDLWWTVLKKRLP